MAGTFILGETKVRPGTYFNIQKKGGNATAGVMNGVTAVIFRADFGPLNEAIELSAEDGYEGTFGYRTYYGRNEGSNRRWRKDDHRLQSR